MTAVLPAGHPLAGRTDLTMADIADLPGLPRGLTVVPVIDAPAVTTVIAWPPHSRSLALAGLVRAATRL